MSKNLKLMILNRTIDMLPETFAEYEDGSISMYTCDIINGIVDEVGDGAVAVGSELTHYIHDNVIGKKTFSVFEFLKIDGIGQIPEDDYAKAYDFRINMIKEMIQKVEKDEL